MLVLTENPARKDLKPLPPGRPRAGAPTKLKRAAVQHALAMRPRRPQWAAQRKSAERLRLHVEQTFG